jgi:hypothetical protein
MEVASSSKTCSPPIRQYGITTQKTTIRRWYISAKHSHFLAIVTIFITVHLIHNFVVNKVNHKVELRWDTTTGQDAHYTPLLQRLTTNTLLLGSPGVAYNLTFDWKYLCAVWAWYIPCRFTFHVPSQWQNTCFYRPKRLNCINQTYIRKLRYNELLTVDHST